MQLTVGKSYEIECNTIFEVKRFTIACRQSSKCSDHNENEYLTRAQWNSD